MSEFSGCVPLISRFVIVGATVAAYYIVLAYLSLEVLRSVVLFVGWFVCLFVGVFDSV